MDRIQAMSTLLAVVRAGSLSAAARDTGFALSVVSKRLAALERRVGSRLLAISASQANPLSARSRMRMRGQRLRMAATRWAASKDHKAHRYGNVR